MISSCLAKDCWMGVELFMGALPRGVGWPGRQHCPLAGGANDGTSSISKSGPKGLKTASVQDYMDF